jgi:hypothetical protein
MNSGTFDRAFKPGFLLSLVLTDDSYAAEPAWNRDRLRVDERVDCN